MHAVRVPAFILYEMAASCNGRAGRSNGRGTDRSEVCNGRGKEAWHPNPSSVGPLAWQQLNSIGMTAFEWKRTVLMEAGGRC